MPCSEGCEECEDDSPCVYKVKITPRVILITIDGVAALLALVIGALVLIYRESKVILFVEIASVVLAKRETRLRSATTSARRLVFRSLTR